MKESTRTVNFTGSEHFTILLGQYTQGNGRMGINKEKEH